MTLFHKICIHSIQKHYEELATVYYSSVEVTLNNKGQADLCIDENQFESSIGSDSVPSCMSIVCMVVLDRLILSTTENHPQHIQLLANLINAWCIKKAIETMNNSRRKT